MFLRGARAYSLFKVTGRGNSVYVAVVKLLSMFREAIWWCGFGLPIFYKHNELNDSLSWTFVKSYFGLSLMTYKERAESTIY